MAFPKTYFLCPVTDVIQAPPAGPLSLGSIILSTSMPQNPLNSGAVVEIDSRISKDVQKPWKQANLSERVLSFGIYARFLQLLNGALPLGQEADVVRSSRRNSIFDFESMTTLSFEPTQAYIQAAVKAAAVQAWLRAPRQRFALSASLFLVTGLKVVAGARIEFSTRKSTSIAGSGGIEAASTGTAIGPKAGWNRVNEQDTKFERESEFVFAFRVKRLSISHRIKDEDYDKGAFLSHKDSLDVGQNIYISIEDVDPATMATAQFVSDVVDGHVYCVPPS